MLTIFFCRALIDISEIICDLIRISTYTNINANNYYWFHSFINYFFDREKLSSAYWMVSINVELLRCTIMSESVAIFTAEFTDSQVVSLGGTWDINFFLHRCGQLYLPHSEIQEMMHYVKVLRVINKNKTKIAN